MFDFYASGNIYRVIKPSENKEEQNLFIIWDPPPKSEQCVDIPQPRFSGGPLAVTPACEWTEATDRPETGQGAPTAVVSMGPSAAVQLVTPGWTSFRSSAVKSEPQWDLFAS